MNDNEQPVGDDIWAKLRAPAAAVPEQRMEEPEAADDVEPQKNVRRAESKVIRWVLVMITAGTLWFLLLNTIYLRQYAARGLPGYQFLYATTKGGDVELQADIQWDDGHSAGVARRPTIVQGAATPLPAPPGARLVSVPVRVEIPQSAAAGRHEGVIHTVLSQAGQSLAVQDVRIGMQVKGVTGRWWILLSWFATLLLFYLFLSVIFRLVKSTPYGELSVAFSDELSPHTIPLRMRRLAILAPWARDVLPLQTLWRQAALDSSHLAVLSGHLEFLGPNIVPMLCDLNQQVRRCSMTKGFPRSQDGRAVKAGTVVPMSGQGFCFWDPAEPRRVAVVRFHAISHTNEGAS
jgi:hypothetical protein